MIVLSGAALVLPDRILSPGTLIIENGRIAEIRPDTPSFGSHSLFAFRGHYIVPGFIDVHVHGVDGVDTLDADAGAADRGGPVQAIAERLTRYGVTAFCPTTVACPPEALRRVLDQVRQLRETPSPQAARVLPAHLESNFVSPEYAGAQPLACLRTAADLKGPPYIRTSDVRASDVRTSDVRTSDLRRPDPSGPADFTAADILAEIERAAPDVGIVTLAPELAGGLDLIKWLTTRGHHVSLGHSGATYDQGLAAIGAGARQATHLFNRMPPLHHREPGLAGAVLQAEEIAAEIVCDGHHVHPAMVRSAIAAKRPARVMAITDGTAASGLAPGSRAMLGGRSIVAGDSVATLADGTIAGSIATMDAVFQVLVGRVGLSLVDAATLCATTPARELGLVGYGMLAVEAVADLVVLDPNLEVVQTYVAGNLAFSRNTAAPGSV